MELTMVSTSTRQSIDAVVEHVQQYKSLGTMDYARLAHDKGIAFLETSLLASSLSVRYDNQDYVFGARHFVPGLRGYELAHEFGHVLLGHTDHSSTKTERVREAEADYFAEQVTGLAHWKYCFIRIPEILAQFVFNTAPALKYVTSYVAVDVALLVLYWNSTSTTVAARRATVSQV